MRKDILALLVVAVVLSSFSSGSLFQETALAEDVADLPRLTAEVFDSGFQWAHDTYNGMGAASDGKIYYVLSSQRHDIGAQMYSFDPATKSIRHVGDIAEVCGDKRAKAIAQGKVHNVLVEREGRLYFGTHVGYYELVEGRELIGRPPQGWQPYRGGHFLAYDLATGQFEDLGTPLPGEAIITMNMDVAHGRLYGLTWPGGHFVTYDLPTKKMKDLGPMYRDGEAGQGDRYRVICRSLAIDPTDGSVYFTIGDGDILRYDYQREIIETVPDENMKKDYFGQYDPRDSGHMAYNWRQVVWYPAQCVFYGVHGNSGYLFRFDPREPRVDVLRRMTSLPSQRCGMFDQFSYGYLGFALGPDGRTLYYLTGAPIYEGGKRLKGKERTAHGEAKGLEDLHLITYDIPTGKYIDHGAVFMPDGQRPLYVNSIALDKQGSVYTLCRIKRGECIITDLIRIPAQTINLEQKETRLK